jgi:uncharacterized membrane protein
VSDDEDEMEYGPRAAEAADMAWQELTPMLGFGLSIPVFFATTYGWVLWILVPLVSVRLRHFNRRNSSGPETT